MKKLLCFLKTIKRTGLMYFLDGVSVDGHNYIETVNDYRKVQVLECEDCGEVSISYR